MSQQPDAQPAADFDEYAEDYDAYLSKGLALAGETKEYFAQARVDWMRRRFTELGVRPQSALDFGCGTGTSTPMLKNTLGLSRALGVDISQRSIDRARPADGVEYRHIDAVTPDGTFDIAFTNGVFHHIPSAEQLDAVTYLRDAVRPGGLVALWENNPYNPATRYGMWANEFDRHAVMLRPGRARKLAGEAGLRVLRTDYVFVFPHVLARLRFMEPFLTRWPIGGQYLVLSQRA